MCPPPPPRPTAPSAPPLPPGARVGRYALRREIGRGSAGVVYEAADEESGRRAAVKVLAPELVEDAQHLGRFFDEARAATLVPHDGLVRFYDFGQVPGGPAYLAMEYLDGESLRARIDRLHGGLPIGEALNVARQVALALHAMHQQGIVHRDLKPENVMLVPGEDGADERAKLLDFGMAKFLYASVRRTAVGTVMGTPAYMSPEQCKGSEHIDERTDVYSLGVVLYEMLCGHPPFVSPPGTSPLVLVMRHLSDEPPPLQQAVPGLPVAVSRLVAAMLVKDPRERLPMSEVASRITMLQGMLAEIEGRATVPAIPALPRPAPPASPPPASPPPASSPPLRAEPGPEETGALPATHPVHRLRVVLLSAAVSLLLLIFLAWFLGLLH